MLASVYSYSVMVKSVSSCCVRGSRVLSNPVTYIITPHEEVIHLKVVPFPYTALCGSYDTKSKNERLHHTKIVNDAMT